MDTTIALVRRRQGDGWRIPTFIGIAADDDRFRTDLEAEGYLVLTWPQFWEMAEWRDATYGPAPELPWWDEREWAKS